MVWLEESRCSSCWLTSVTCGIEANVSSFDDLSAVPPPCPPKNPAGVTRMVVPVDALTESILELTAWRASSMAMASATTRASTAMVPTERTTLRNAFRQPRIKTDMVSLGGSIGCGHLVDAA